MNGKNNFKNYKLTFKESARKELKKIDYHAAVVIEEKLQEMIKGSLTLDIKKMKGFAEPTYRLRHGDYRIIFNVYHDRIVILVIAIGHHQSIYK